MMNYKDTLFFIGKCLTINHEEHNKVLVEEELKLGNINWENIVKVSTAHYVFPALYCNLKKVDFLKYVPNDLVEYMQHITDLNRERNEQIISQAKEINNLLLDNNITPIFLKGTGNLLEGLYDDIAERMVGDIDFLVAEEDLFRAVEILKNHNYEKVSKKISSPVFQKHYPRMFNDNRIAAIEVHLKIIKGKLSNFFNYKTIKNTIKKEGVLTFLSYKNQLVLSTLATQYNDNGYYYKKIALRNSYDVYLLSLKENCLNTLTEYPIFFNFLNSYFAVSALFFNSKKITYKSLLKTKKYIKILILKIENTFFNKLHTKTWVFLLFIYRIYLGSIRFLKNKQFRNYYLKRLSS